MSDAARLPAVIVVGLGAMGAAVLYQLAVRGVAALGIDRFVPPHDHGSSHGESRVTRQAVGEGAAYAPLVQRSHAIWRELEAQTGESLLHAVGGLVMAPSGGAANHHGAGDFVQRTIAVARQNGIPHEVLAAAEIIARFPQFLLRGDETGYFEPGAGLVHPERCIAAQLAIAQRLGARVHLSEQVQAVRAEGTGVVVTTDQGVYRAGHAVLAAGPWLPALLGHTLSGVLRVTRQVLHWFATTDPAAWAAARSPVFIWMHGDAETDYLYGFPASADGSVKVATEQYTTSTTADAANRYVDPAESHAMYQAHIAGRLAGVGPDCLRASACLYTVTPDRGFLVDQHPDHAQITLVSACSGHGFKHSAALGEAVAQSLAAGRPTPILAPFGAARFAACT